MADNNNTYDNTSMVSHIDDGTHTLQVVRKVLELGLSLPMAVLGIVGNILALVVLRRYKHRQTTTVLFQALAVADILVLVSGIVVRSARLIYPRSSFYTWFHYMCRWMYPTNYFIRLIDTWITVLLTVDRFIAVCHPLQATRMCTMKRTYYSLVAVVVHSFLFSLPRYFEYQIVPGIYPSTNRTGHFFATTPIVNNQIYNVGYRICAFFVVMYLVPMVLLISLNASLLFALRKARRERSSLRLASDHPRSITTRNNSSVTFIVITVVVMCVACNSSAMVSHILWSIQLTYKRYEISLNSSRRYASNISNVLVTLNSAINFIIYCLCSRNFRVILLGICSCRQRRPGLMGEAATLMRRGNSTWSSSSTNQTQSFRLSSLNKGNDIPKTNYKNFNNYASNAITAV